MPNTSLMNSRSRGICIEKAVLLNIPFIYCGFILFIVLNISRARFLRPVTSLLV